MTGPAVGVAPAAIRVVLPHHLRNLAGVEHEVLLEVESPVTLERVIDTLEGTYPPLLGTVRDPATGRRRAFVRFFACEEDLSHNPPDAALPAPVAEGREPLHVVGAMAGG